MTGIIKLELSMHQKAQELLPWYVSQTLDEDELALVQKHVATCKQCQADVEWQRRLRAVELPAEAGAAADVERALGQLRPRLKPSFGVAARRRLDDLRQRLRHADARWMGWGLALQFALIAGMGVLLVQDHRQDAYRVLGSAANESGNVVVMFKPDTSEQQMRALLQEAGARVVDGPTVTDAYLLHTAGSPQDAVSLLRSRPQVMLAEALDSGGSP